MNFDLGISYEPLRPGKIDLVKRSANTDITNGNDCYSLAGAVYGVWTYQPAQDNISPNTPYSITTNTDGYGVSTDIPAGVYWVKETKAPKGYYLENKDNNPQAYQVVVGGGITVRVNGDKGGVVYDEPAEDPAYMFAYKLEGETSTDKPMGDSKLAGAEFTVRYYDGIYGSVAEAEASGAPTRTWVVRTDTNGAAKLEEQWLVKGDPFYKNSAGMVTLPIGTILIQETKAPEGHIIDPTVDFKVVTEADAVITVSRYHAPAKPNYVKRGDLALDKYSAVSLRRLANIR